MAYKPGKAAQHFSPYQLQNFPAEKIKKLRGVYNQRYRFFIKGEHGLFKDHGHSTPGAAAFAAARAPAKLKLGRINSTLGHLLALGVCCALRLK
jgi:hypothetical protein